MPRSTLAAKTLTRPKPAKARRAAEASPAGSAAEEAASRRAARSPKYRTQQAEREGFREIAWLLIKYRMDKGLSQEELAELVGTSHSQISRIESGRHRTNLDTLSRMAHALDLRMVLGFESTTSSGRAKRELVTF
ncbi:MAG TPA: helix-turn-helix transcriptional regulator [Acidimicrobiales bacterium]|nr:helix-turn-helix transcriptional regulator [Acidimicrobiales bacterium]